MGLLFFISLKNIDSPGGGMAYRIQWEEKGLCRTYSGSVTGEEIIEANCSATGDSRFDNLNYIIADFLRVTASDIDILDMKKIAAMNYAASKTNPNVKFAIIATDENLQALAVLFEFESEELKVSWETALFSTEVAARKWVSS